MVKLLFTDLFIVTLSYHEEEAGDANPSLFFLQEYDCDWCNFVFTLKPDIKQHISSVHNDFKYNKRSIGKGRPMFIVPTAWFDWPL